MLSSYFDMNSCQARELIYFYSILVPIGNIFFYLIYFYLDREMEKRKHESRNELEARRMERRRRGKKRSVSPQEASVKKSKTSHSPGYGESVVTVSDASDVEMKSDSPHTDHEEGIYTFNTFFCVNFFKSFTGFKMYVTSLILCEYFIDYFSFIYMLIKRNKQTDTVTFVF